MNNSQGNSNTRRHQIAVIIPLPLNNFSGNEENENHSLFSSQQENNSWRPRAILLLIMSESLFSEDEDTFGDLLNRLFQSYQPQGPPPASKKAIEALPKVKITEKILSEFTRCPVCFEEYEIGDNNDKIIIKMPCKHILHKDCIKVWLEQHNTCPVCRYEMPVEDEEYEKKRKERMSERHIDEDTFFGNLLSKNNNDDDENKMEIDESINSNENNEILNLSPNIEFNFTFPNQLEPIENHLENELNIAFNNLRYRIQHLTPQRNNRRNFFSRAFRWVRRRLSRTLLPSCLRPNEEVNIIPNHQNNNNSNNNQNNNQNNNSNNNQNNNNQNNNNQNNNENIIFMEENNQNLLD